MKKILSAGVIAICIMIMLVACDRPDVADIGDTSINSLISNTNIDTIIPIDEPLCRIIMHDVCTKNGFPLVGEPETRMPGVSEIILCGKIEKLMGGLVIDSDDSYFDGYKWPWGESSPVRFKTNELYDIRGDRYEITDEAELIGLHVMLICDSAAMASYPGQLSGQRVTVILKDTQQSIDVSDYREIMRKVCNINGIEYIDGTTMSGGFPNEIILCGKFEDYGMYGSVIVPDDAYFPGYTWPWGTGDDVISLHPDTVYKSDGSIYDYKDISELYGHHLMLICESRIAESYPGQIYGVRAVVFFDN